MNTGLQIKVDLEKPRKHPNYPERFSCRHSSLTVLLDTEESVRLSDRQADRQTSTQASQLDASSRQAHQDNEQLGSPAHFPPAKAGHAVAEALNRPRWIRPDLRLRDPHPDPVAQQPSALTLGRVRMPSPAKIPGDHKSQLSPRRCISLQRVLYLG